MSIEFLSLTFQLCKRIWKLAEASCLRHRPLAMSQTGRKAAYQDQICIYHKQNKRNAGSEPLGFAVPYWSQPFGIGPKHKSTKVTYSSLRIRTTEK